MVFSPYPTPYHNLLGTHYQTQLMLIEQMEARLQQERQRQSAQQQKRQWLGAILFEVAEFAGGQAVRSFPMASTTYEACGIIWAQAQNRPLKVVLKVARTIEAANRI